MKMTEPGVNTQIFLIPVLSLLLFSLYDPIVGTENNDVLLGTALDDSLWGLGGNDQILGMAGNDWIKGGKGNDVIDGGLGDDLILWSIGDGIDVITGGTGHDTLIVDAGGKEVDDDGTTIRIDGQIAIGAYANVVTRFENAFVPPTVTIRSPSDGTQFETGQPLTFAIDAFDPDGSVERVELYWGDALLITKTDTPYVFVRNSVLPGCYEIHARAIDDDGFEGTSARISFQVGLQCGQAPYLGEPLPIPGTLEVENYDLGGMGISYSDQDIANSGNEFGNTYRTEEGVDIEPSLDTDGGFNVGWIFAGEWMNYTVNVEQTGRYKIEARVASSLFGGVFDIEIDGERTIGPFNVSPTGGWQTWESVSIDDVELEAGTQLWRINMITNGININKLIIAESTSTTAIQDEVVPSIPILSSGYPNPFPDQITLTYSLSEPVESMLQVFDIQGRLIETLVQRMQPRGTYSVPWNAVGQPAGVYIVRLRAGNHTLSRAIVKL